MAERPPLTHSSYREEGGIRGSEGGGLGGPRRQKPGIPTISHPTPWPGLSLSHMTHSNRPPLLSLHYKAGHRGAPVY